MRYWVSYDFGYKAPWWKRLWNKITRNPDTTGLVIYKSDDVQLPVWEKVGK